MKRRRKACGTCATCRGERAMLRVSSSVHAEIADVYSKAADFFEAIESARGERAALAGVINARGSRVLS